MQKISPQPQRMVAFALVRDVTQGVPSRPPRAVSSFGMDVDTQRWGMRPISNAVTSLVLAGALIGPVALPAQQPSDSGCFAQPRARADTTRRAPSTADSVRGSDRRTGADVVLLASVSAREVRFQSQPEISVRLCGGFDSVRVVERRNLPERIVPGVTYRDVYIAVEILGHVYADCLRERLAAERSGACPGGADSSRAAPRRAPR